MERHRRRAFVVVFFSAERRGKNLATWARLCPDLDHEVAQVLLSEVAAALQYAWAFMPVRTRRRVGYMLSPLH